MDNKCVVCGEVIPEGRQVCPKCEADRNARFDYAMGIKARPIKRVGKTIGAISAVVVVMLIAFVFSWLTTCGLWKAVTLCFNWSFDLRKVTICWFVAVGVFFVFGLLSAFSGRKTRR